MDTALTGGCWLVDVDGVAEEYEALNWPFEVKIAGCCGVFA
jgi:hypothetical protein